MDQKLGLDLFFEHKDFAFRFDKNNEVALRELTRFLNEYCSPRGSPALTEEALAEAIRADRFANMKAFVTGAKVLVEELRGLGHDWVIADTTVEMERTVLEALRGGATQTSAASSTSSSTASATVSAFSSKTRSSRR